MRPFRRKFSVPIRNERPGSTRISVYDFPNDMTNSIALPCDGCGQIASAEHLVRRLQRLEWTTRYRPVHINTLLLGAFSPIEEKDFLYSPGDEFHGEAALLLQALAPVLEEIQTSKLGCPVVLDLGKPFRFDGPAPEHAVARLREALAAAAAD